MEYKRFVRAGEEEDGKSSRRRGRSRPVLQQQTLDGLEARSFYDSIIGSSDSNTSTPVPGSSGKDSVSVVRGEGSKDTTAEDDMSERNRRDRSQIRKRSRRCDTDSSTPLIVRSYHTEKKLKPEDLLRFAQTGDVSGVEKCLKQGLCVDCVDFYGWTPLMCAACEGHSKVVRCLVDNGASWRLANSKGQAALDLARSRGCDNVVRYLERVSTGEVDLSGPRFREEAIREEFRCEVCQGTFSSTSYDEHLTSTLHQFNRKLKPTSSYFFLTRATKGYQLLLKEGWDQKSGLGPEGKGLKQPVKTVLKRDKLGFGFSKPMKARVTHFEANDASAVKRPKEDVGVKRGRGYTRQQRVKAERKQRQFEINLRNHFNTDSLPF